MELVDHSQDAVLPPSFGASLRAARLRRNISLDAIAALTKINRSFFQDLERNDLSKWPASQFYRETYLRAYSAAVGLDPQEVIDGFRRELTVDASNPELPAAGPRRLTPVTIPIILAVTLVTSYSLARWLPVSTGTAQTPVAAPGNAILATTPAASSPGETVSTPKADLPPSTEEAAAAVPAVPEPVVERVAGELVITSTPPGAYVLVNGIRRGSTPLTLTSLPAGSYSIRLILPGHTGITQQATISAGKRSVQVSASFETDRPAPAAE